MTCCPEQHRDQNKKCVFVIAVNEIAYGVDADLGRKMDLEIGRRLLIFEVTVSSTI
jgi:hypothetical protein